MNPPDPLQTEQAMDCRHVRIARSSAYREYLANTEMWRQVGNGEFARRVRDGSISGSSSQPPQGSFTQEFVLYHAWLPGTIGTSEAGAAIARRLARGIAVNDLDAGERAVLDAFRKMGWCSETEVDLDALVQRTQTHIVAIQNVYEQTEYLKLVRERRPKIVVEIGTARGGMLYCFSQLADPGAELISVDLPGAPNCGGQTENEREFFRSFGCEGQRFHFIPENSLHYTTRNKVAAILDGRKADLLFIDGDHSYGGVHSDFEMYRDFLAPGGLLTLHDICMLPENWGPGNEVGIFWREIKSRYHTQEFIDSAGAIAPGGREGEVYAWGIGLIGQPF